MTGLVQEIQRDAIDPNTSVATLLRKVKLAAAKLQLSAVEEWVDNELNGYSSGALPAYRQIRGVPKAFNYFRNGWIPITGDPETVDAIARAHNGQPVAAIEDLLKGSKGDLFQQPLPNHVIHALNESSDVELGEMANFISRGALVSIMDKVRNMVLDWAIELEKSGISGEGMSFKSEEKLAAHNNPAITIGSIGTLVGVVGSQNHVRDIVGGNVNVAQIRGVAQQLRSNHDTLVQEGANGPALEKAVERLLVEIEKAEPDRGTVHGLLSDVRSALAGAAGNMMATGALSLIGSLLGS